MAGLLDRITRQLKKSNKSTVKKIASDRATTVRVKPVSVPVAEDWVKNSTISEADVCNISVEIEKTPANKRERIDTEVQKEDYLLNQIDEFREKAQQLQELLLSKESKVVELQSIVDEREIKAKELEEILNERQRKADGITDEVSKQIDNLIEKVSAKMEEIGSSIGSDLENGQKLSEEQIAQLKETLASLTEQLDTIKSELSEKVHSENVKCYRNVADLFKSMDEKFEKLNVDTIMTLQKVKSVEKCSKAVIILSVINMIGLAALALYELGVFQLIFAK